MTAPSALLLEMSDLEPEEYLARRTVAHGCPLAVFTNERLGRRDLPRTHREFATLGVIESAESAPLGVIESAESALLGECEVVDAAPSEPSLDLVARHRFVRTSRPGQGSLTGEATNGLLLVLISPRDPARAQELRDWADFVHIRHIAEAAVPGFGMITPYANVAANGPRFLHYYELHTDDPEAAFQAMTPQVARRLGGDDTDAFRAWARHSQLHIDYVNTFRRVG